MKGIRKEWRVSRYSFSIIFIPVLLYAELSKKLTHVPDSIKKLVKWILRSSSSLKSCNFCLTYFFYSILLLSRIYLRCALKMGHPEHLISPHALYIFMKELIIRVIVNQSNPLDVNYSKIYLPLQFILANSFYTILFSFLFWLWSSREKGVIALRSVGRNMCPYSIHCVHKTCLSMCMCICIHTHTLSLYIVERL